MLLKQFIYKRWRSYDVSDFQCWPSKESLFCNFCFLIVAIFSFPSSADVFPAFFGERHFPNPFLLLFRFWPINTSSPEILASVCSLGLIRVWLVGSNVKCFCFSTSFLYFSKSIFHFLYSIKSDIFLI